MKIFLLYLSIFILTFYGCDKGLAPLSAESAQKAGFSGTITFKGNWPEGITRTHIIVFKDPINSAGDFNLLNLSYISYEIPYGVKEFVFNTSVDSAYIPIDAGEYSYVVVAQSSIPTVSFNRTDWTVAGVYYANGDTTTPGKLLIPANTVVQNINITCDFNSPPPQPPGGK